MKFNSIVSTLLIVVLIALLLPIASMTALADGADNGPDGIENGGFSNTLIRFGYDGGTTTRQWYIVEAASDSLLLLSKDVAYGESQPILGPKMDHDGRDNLWEGGDWSSTAGNDGVWDDDEIIQRPNEIRDRLNAASVSDYFYPDTTITDFFFNTTDFTAFERQYMICENIFIDGYGGDSETNDYVFLLSYDQVNNLMPNPSDRVVSVGGNPVRWWLITPQPTTTKSCYVVETDGSFNGGYANSINSYVRPAIRIERDMIVMFTPESGKATSSGNVLPLWSQPTGNVKMTVVSDEDTDIGSTFAITNTGVQEIGSSQFATYNYTGATVADDAYIACKIVQNGAVVSYGVVEKPTSASGSFQIGASNLTPDSDYTVYIWQERHRETTQMDYASTPITAPLTVLPPITITDQPDDTESAIGGSATFNVTVSGTPTITYQWYKNGVEIVGATSASYTDNDVQPEDAGDYTVTATNPDGSTTSDAAYLNVLGVPVTFDTHPTGYTVEQEVSVSMSVATSGTRPITYQWYQDGQLVSGATNSTYTINSTTRSDSGSYTVVATNPEGAVTSNATTLTVLAKPATIHTNPVGKAIEEGESHTMKVIAGGDGPFTYQWRKDSVDIDGATSDTFAITDAQLTDSGTYTVVVTNERNSVTSLEAVVSVLEAPIVIVTQPQSQTVAVGHPITLTVEVTGSNPTYTWHSNLYANGRFPIPGATGPTFTIDPAALSDTGMYFAYITNSRGNTRSDVATVTVEDSPVTITTHPQDQLSELGATTTFTVESEGSWPITYQWYKDGVPIDSTSSDILTITNTAVEDEGTYHVTLTNSHGTETSTTANLTVNVDAVAITSQPQSTSVYRGEDARFTVAASGTNPEYQWFKDNGAISGATSDTLTVENVGGDDVGSYSVQISNARNSVTSNAAVLTRLSGKDATLSSLAIDGQSVDGFVAATTEYQIDVAHDTMEVTIGATSTDEYASVFGTGTFDITNDTQMFSVSVVAEDGKTTQTYNVTVNRLPDDDPTLSDLTVSGRTVSGFTSDDTDYRVYVTHETSSISIGATLSDENATMHGTGSYSFEGSSRTITVTVIAEDAATTKSYKVAVVRLPDEDATLSDLMVNGQTVPGFDPEETAYEVSVESDVTKISLSTIASDINAGVSGTGTFDMEEDSQTFTVTCTAEDGKTTQSYTVSVTRKAADEPAIAPSEEPTPSPYASETQQTTVVIPQQISVIEDTGTVIVGINIADLPEDTTAVQTPDGETISIDDAVDGVLMIEVDTDSLDEEGRLELVTLNEELIPLGAITVDVASEVGKAMSAEENDQAPSNALAIILWIMGVLLAVGGVVFIILKLRKRNTGNA